MEPRLGRIVLLVFAAITAFAGVVGLLLMFFPEPRQNTDYLVVGTLATFASLLAIFVLVVAGVLRSSDGLFFRRKNG
ncbi:MAG: hypothetical protein FJW39_22730 [Acidobacteria bacterium]|nr:hypothetical protein [Acidobacteriota bacterium]